MRNLLKICVLTVLLTATAHFLIPSAADGQDAPARSSQVPEGVPASAAQDASAGAREHGLPLPSSVPPKKFVEFEHQILTFLQKHDYRTLKWAVDKRVRDTGPYSKGVYYGTHPAVRVYYSPKVMQWLTTGRQGDIPDGGMIIKEQYHPPASRYAQLGDDKLPPVDDWTIMIRDSKGSKDGWFWGEFFDKMVFDDDQPPFQYPWAGYGLYCVRCHASAEKELTFSSLNNIKGFYGDPIDFPDDGSWRGNPAGTEIEGTLFPLVALKPARRANPDILRTFNSVPEVKIENVQKMLSETYDHIPAPATLPAQFISSSQCMSCHGGLTGPFGPTMFLPSSKHPELPKPAEKVWGANVSPYGEWRWSPMGLAGRDPIFFAQLESEFAYFDTLQPPNRENFTKSVTNTCMTCHGAMGKAQLDEDNNGSGKKGDFQLSFLQIKERSDPNFKYGALARDGISCQVCHRNAPDPTPTPTGEAPLVYFLNNSINGKFPLTKPDELYGPYKDDEIAPYSMEHSTGIKPRFNPYIKSSRMCGSCHTIDLPVLDSSIPGQKSIEQATYLEWLNSGYQTEFGVPTSNAKSCQDCHMPDNYHSENKAKPIDYVKIKDKMAIIEDESYPKAEFPAPADKITVRVRKEGFRRHELLGLNVFLLQMFDQFNDVLGVRKTDYMTGSYTDLQDAIDNYVQQARSRTAEIKASASVTGPQQIQADVAITNLTGHRLPTGVGFRRMFIELLVTDDDQNVVWASGRTNDLGVIVDGTGKSLPSEFFDDYKDRDGKVQQSYQPHYEMIDKQDHVQIYEELLQDATHKFTTSFTRRDVLVKDNRLLPHGWTEKGPDPSLNGRYLDATHPEGTAKEDPDYQDGKAGTDHITYKIELPPGVGAKKCRVRASLYYQAIPPSYLKQRFTGAPDGEATKRLHYLTSHLNLTGTPVQCWKLPIVSTGPVAPQP